MKEQGLLRYTYREAVARFVRGYCRADNDRFAGVQTPNRLYFHEIGAHTLASKLSEPLGLVAGLPRQVFTLA
jgi:hypothetical protein